MFVQSEAHGPEWLPSLSALPISPGVANVDKYGEDTGLRVASKKRSWVVLDWDKVPAGTPGGQYIRAYPARGGHYHCSTWEIPQVLGDLAIDSVTDTDGYYSWLRWLIAEGHVPSPSEPAIRRIVDQQRKRYQEILKSDNDRLITQAADLLEGMESTLKPTPTPTPKKTSAKAS
jgi:hypothetical protein